MNIEQLYTTCLAQGAYYISSNGEVAIIDPLRETQQYIDRANREKAKIKYVFETHFHADFVSGHIDLARKTNSTIVYGPGAETDYPCHIAKDQEEFNIGKKMCMKLKSLIPRQQFDIAIQSAIGAKIISRETVKALRKDVTAK